MTLADKLHPVVPMLNGFAPEPVPVLITYGVLLDCKMATGVDMLPGVNPASCSAALLRALIWASLRRSGREISLREVGAKIRPKKLPELRSLLVAAFAASLPDPPVRRKAAGKPEGKPPKPKPPMTWIEVQAVARIQFGLSDEEWMVITPRQFAGFRTAYQERTQDIEQMIATLTAHTINFSARGPEKMLAPNRFLLHPPPPEEEQENKPVTGEDIMQVFAAIRAGKN